MSPLFDASAHESLRQRPKSNVMQTTSTHYQAL
jgi:hypothetical protein